MTIKRKLKSRSGFTLAETLLAVLILLLVSTIVANGIPVARNVYNNVIIGANAQVLLSTSITALRNELDTARDITIGSDEKTITYFNANPSIQAYSKISLDGSPATIKIDPYISSVDKCTPLLRSEQRDLVTNSASNKNLYISYEKVIREKDATTGDDTDIIVFKDLTVKRLGGSSELAYLSELKIRLISESVSLA